VDNLLDEGLHVRQHEWHQLYVVRSHCLCGVSCVLRVRLYVCVCVCVCVCVRCVLLTSPACACVCDGQDGRIFERVDDQAELCYFQYASPIFFVSGRDTCYIKMRRDLDDGGFILSYRSIRHDVPSLLLCVIVCVCVCACFPRVRVRWCVWLRWLTVVCRTVRRTRTMCGSSSRERT
jgi:hypothetical protein